MELVSDTAVQEDPNAGGWRVEFHHPLNKATESALRSSMPLNIKIIPYKISKNFSRNGQDQAVAEFLEACSGFARDSMRLSSRGVPASFDCKKQRARWISLSAVPLHCAGRIWRWRAATGQR